MASEDCPWGMVPAARARSELIRITARLPMAISSIAAIHPHMFVAVVVAGRAVRMRGSRMVHLRVDLIDLGLMFALSVSQL